MGSGALGVRRRLRGRTAELSTGHTPLQSAADLRSVARRALRLSRVQAYICSLTAISPKDRARALADTFARVWRLHERCQISSRARLGSPNSWITARTIHPSVRRALKPGFGFKRRILLPPTCGPLRPVCFQNGQDSNVAGSIYSRTTAQLLLNFPKKTTQHMRIATDQPNPDSK